MRCKPKNPECTLLVQRAGAGKSSIYQTIGVVDAGIVLIIENTLSLGADQATKIREASSDYGSVNAFQLDSIKTTASRTNLIKYLCSITPTTHSTAFLFSSPETLLQPCWNNLIKGIVNRKTLKLLCMDEVHQHVHFGTAFRKSFCKLKDHLFKYIIDKNNSCRNPPSKLKLPILAMTATMNADLLETSQKMIGIAILKRNIFWSSKNEFNKRQIRIDVIPSQQSFRVVKKYLVQILSPAIFRKCIIYGDAAKSLEYMKDKIDNELNIPIGNADDNLSNIPGDTLLIAGDIEPELKLSYADTFTSRSEETVDFNENFSPRILIATASYIGAGLDSDEVYGAIRVGFPESMLNLTQEMGRCGRNRDNNDGDPTDTFVLIISLNDFIYMFERVFDTNDSYVKESKETLESFNAVTNRESKEESQRKDLLEVLKSLALKHDGKCIHDELEKAVSDPFSNSESNHNNNKCSNACPLCLNKFSKMCLPVKKEGVQNFLATTFLSSQGNIVDIGAIQTDLRTFPDVGKEIYGRKTVKAPESKFIQMTILQLVAAEILDVAINKENMKATFKLGVQENIHPTCLIDEYWKGVSLID